MKRVIVPILISILLLLSIFRQWFLPGLLSGGDLTYYFPSMISSFSIIPYAWEWYGNNGFGGFVSPFLSDHYNDILLVIFGGYFHLSWQIIERITQLYPTLIIGFLSIWYVSRKFIAQKFFIIFSVLLFLCNTYFLMLVGGGQFIVALAYAMSPLVLYAFIRFIMTVMQGETPFWSKKIVCEMLVLGLLLSVEVMFDLRITYVIVVGIILYFLVYTVIFFQSKNTMIFMKRTVVLFLQAGVIPSIIVLLLHLFWILPTLMNHQNPLQELGSAYTSTNAVTFLSFATFENTLSLLHPNWPENIFGVTHFMKPEFLLLPILAFASLLFLNNSNSKIRNPKSEIQNTLITEQAPKITMSYFAVLGLLGAFLAKGTNDPFGSVYLWLFHHLPGFIMFRDPTKWYTLIAISFSVLVPFSIVTMYQWLQSQTKFSIKSKNKIFNFPNLFLLLIFFYLLFLIRPAILGQLEGTFQSTHVPTEYIRLDNKLSQISQFSRILWLPQKSRFGSSTTLHPSVNANDFFTVYDPNNLITKLYQPNILTQLQDASIGYIVVPYDSEHEIFITNGQYDEKKYISIVNQLAKIPWLEKMNDFGKMAVFKVPTPRSHFWSSDSQLELHEQMINPTHYVLQVMNARVGEPVIFSESYDPGWQAAGKDFSVIPQPFNDRFTSFVLPKNGNYALDIAYTPEIFVTVGVLISIVSLIALLLVLAFLSDIKRWVIPPFQKK